MPSIYEWPAAWYEFISSTFRLQARSQVTPRTWIGGKSVYGPHAQLWVTQVALARQHWNTKGQSIAAFFSRLDGQANLIRIGHFQRLQPHYNRTSVLIPQAWSDGTFFDNGSGWRSGFLPDLCTVALAASRGDSSVQIGGLPISTFRVLRRGDLFEIRPGGVSGEQPHLYEVQVDGHTDVNGKTTVEIRPRLRANITTSDTVVLSYPTSVFRLVDDDQGVPETDHPNLMSLGFSLVEAII